MHKPLLVVITGPTGVGKSAVALQLAQHFHTKILSADSRQFYKEIPIGTAQPNADELSTVPHYFIADRTIHEHLDAGAFAEEAHAVLSKEFATHQVLILCGGSGLYIDAVIRGFDKLPEVPEEIRSAVKKKFAEEGIEALQQELHHLDPEHYAAMDHRNPSRLMRAIELCRASGSKYSELRKGAERINEFETLIVCIDLPREELYARIDARVDEMMKQGLEEEARRVFPFKGLSALSTVGYKELFEFFEGKVSLDRSIELIKQHSRNYAKRQLTWWRNREEVIWIHPSEPEQLIRIVNEKMQRLV